MGIKCSSCGSPQNINNQLICSYCGSQLNIENKSNESEVDSFELAVYKYNEGKYGKANKLFDDILQNNQSIFSAWVYMIFSKELKNEKDSLINLNTKDIDIIFNKVSSLNDIELIEKLLLKNYEKECSLFISGNLVLITTPFLNEVLSSYKRMASYKIEAKIKFVENLIYLSQKCSNHFSSRLILHLIYSLDFPLKNKESFSNLTSDFIIPIDRIIMLVPILKKDIENSEILISKIIELNNKILNQDFNSIDRGINFDLNNKTYFSSKSEIAENIKTLNDYLNFSELLISELKNTGLVLNIRSLPVTSKNITKNSLNELTSKLEKLKNTRLKEENSSRCFIATATMGTYDHPIVVDLRLFRDSWLLKREWGVSFTSWYYTHGPKAAKIIEGSFILKKLTFFTIIKPLHFFTKKYR